MFAFARLLPKADLPLSAHVWTALRWQGLSSVRQGWSVRPCVRPVGAARMAAGHNAFREDGSRTTPRARGALADWVFPLFGSTGWLRYVRVALPKLVGVVRPISTRLAAPARDRSRRYS